MEMSGLRLGRVSAGVVSEADRRNGLEEVLYVQVECGTHRTRATGADAWSAWMNGNYILFPTMIYVERRGGNWVAKQSMLERFGMIGSSAPVAASAESRSLPPGMSRTGGENPRPISPATIPVPSPVREPQAPPARPTLPLPPREDHRSFKPAPVPRPGANLSNAVNHLLMQILTCGSVLAALSLLPVLITLRRGKSRRNSCRGAVSQSVAAGTSSGPPSLLPPPLPAGGPSANQEAIGLTARNETLLTPAELSFFHVLERLVVPRYRVSSKVRLADLFDVKRLPGHRAALNKIIAKHVDFVVCEPATSKVLVAIELDDRSHEREDRIERDHFVNELFASNGLPLLRIPVEWSYNPVALRAKLVGAGLVV